MLMNETEEPQNCTLKYTWILNTVSNGRDEQVLSCAPCTHLP